MKEIIAIFTRQFNEIDPITSKRLPKSQRIKTMYDIIQNNHYEKSYTN